MKKSILLALSLGLFLSASTVVAAHDKDVGYSPPQIEKQSITYDLFDLNVTMIAPASPDVGNVVTAHYDVNYPVAEVPANDLLITSPRVRSQSYIAHQYRRQVKETKKYTRIQSDPVQLE